MDPAIQSFLDKRKEDWLKGRLKNNLSEEEQSALLQEAGEKFSLVEWLPDAAKRAGQLSLVSHPSKFSHPGSSCTAIIADAPYAPDGFLRSGNLVTDLDWFGNAAALDVNKFLSLILIDGKTILEHLETNSEYIQNEFSISTESYRNLAQGFLSVKKSNSDFLTHERIKQVYFPVEEDYHLLSVLTPSGILFELTQQIRELKFSEASKQAREDKKHDRLNTQGYDDVFNLTLIGFGGTKPQNISVLNNQNGGKAYLLPSLPPVLEQRELRLPTRDFFRETLWYRHFQESFQRMHRLLIADINNLNIRQGRDHWILSILDQVLQKVWAFREQPQGWSEGLNYKDLHKYQKIWLDDLYLDERISETDWISRVIEDFSRWFIFAYAKNLGDLALPLKDDDFYQHLKSLLHKHEEAFL